MKYFIFILLMTCPLLFAGEYDVLSDWLIYSDVENSLYHYYANRAFACLAERRAHISKLTTLADWQNRQAEIRATLYRIVGPFPHKTPLKPRITGTFEHDDMVIEKIVYESQPGFYVTACLFLPKERENKAPTIIYCSGHTTEGFRSATYQRVILNLVQKGFIVFAFDPIGQGERLLYYDPQTKASKIGGPTKEHSYPGAQCFLIGSSLAKYMIWDGIRAVDYLLSRNEVDPTRIGITGRSGGGTQSAYIAAFDERITASAPECYITSFQRLIESIGLQDAEQNLYHGLANGIDFADLLEVRAPKPTLIVATTRDFFSIQGMYETFQEARLIYDQYGLSKNINFAADDSTHASTRKNREALYDFFMHTFQVAGDVSDQDVQILSNEALYVTDSGQVSTSYSSETVFSLNKKQTVTLLSDLDSVRLSPHYPKAIIEQIRNQIRHIPSEKPEPVFTGRFTKHNLLIEKWFLKNRYYVTPVLTVRPNDNVEHPAIIYITPRGKQDALQKEWLQEAVARGTKIIIPDLIGYGESGPGDFHGDAYDFKVGSGAYNIWFFGLQLDESLVYVRVRQLLDLLSYLQGTKEQASPKLRIIGEGLACTVVQYTAALESSLADVVLLQPLLSYASLVENEYYAPELIHATVPGALAYHDLKDINCCIAPRNLIIINPVDQHNMPYSHATAPAIKKFIEYYQKPKWTGHIKIYINISKLTVDSMLKNF
ncbi:acetylxylan esterase [candidate division KSB1 bacterium]|nr:acetylxylan esterase [candidate division KSB1 bacterium]